MSASVKSGMVYLSGTGLPGLSWKKAVKRVLLLLLEGNEELISDTGQQQSQQCEQEEAVSKTVQITVQSAESSHKKRYFTCHVSLCVAV